MKINKENDMSKNPGWDQRIMNGEWRDKKGHVYKLSEMTEDHIQKVIWMMEEKLKVAKALEDFSEVAIEVMGHLPPDIAAFKTAEAKDRLTKQKNALMEELASRGWK